MCYKLHIKVSSPHKELVDTSKKKKHEEFVWALKETLKSCKTNLFDSNPARAITVDKEPTSKIYKNCLKLWNRVINVQELGKN